MIINAAMSKFILENFNYSTLPQCKREMSRSRYLLGGESKILGGDSQSFLSGPLTATGREPHKEDGQPFLPQHTLPDRHRSPCTRIPLLWTLMRLGIEKSSSSREVIW